MYHYIRDLPNTAFPRIKGMLIRDFHAQLMTLRHRYEMATPESALDFLRGAYTPSRDLCLLTFDDGLKEHYTEVTPLLVDCHIQGLFFVITSCLQEQHVAPVHMNHFLMAALDFAGYQRAFLQRLGDFAPHLQPSLAVGTSVVRHTYPWDTPEVASFKYLINFMLNWDIRDQVIKSLFEEHIADEQSFSASLYLNWEEARQMQTAGMLIGGHSHQHKPLAKLTDEGCCWELRLCHELLMEHLNAQTFWPFCYPYGQSHSFNDTTIGQLKRLGFAHAFSTEVGVNLPGVDEFALYRVDCNDVLK
jgi:peptidoglycan/xylan/chitin deacetylase (PgdA/CDA1 family)